LVIVGITHGIIMKYIFLLSLLAMNTVSLWAISTDSPQKAILVEKNNVSVKYWACPICTTKKFGPAYFITIKNNSADPIIIGPSLITAPLYTNYHELARDMRERIKPFAKLASGTTAATGFTTFMAWYLSKKTGQSLTHTIYGGIAGGIVGTGILTIFDAALFFIFASAEKFIAHTILKEPITIQPGKSAMKRFWLKNPTDPVSINFDAIKVLK